MSTTREEDAAEERGEAEFESDDGCSTEKWARRGHREMRANEERDRTQVAFA